MFRGLKHLQSTDAHRLISQLKQLSWQTSKNWRLLLVVFFCIWWGLLAERKKIIEYWSVQKSLVWKFICKISVYSVNNMQKRFFKEVKAVSRWWGKNFSEDFCMTLLNEFWAIFRVIEMLLLVLKNLNIFLSISEKKIEELFRKIKS